jgi:hypothetical protein
VAHRPARAGVSLQHASGGVVGGDRTVRGDGDGIADRRRVSATRRQQRVGRRARDSGCRRPLRRAHLHLRHATVSKGTAALARAEGDEPCCRSLGVTGWRVCSGSGDVVYVDPHSARLSARDVSPRAECALFLRHLYRHDKNAHYDIYYRLTHDGQLQFNFNVDELEDLMHQGVAVRRKPHTRTPGRARLARRAGRELTTLGHGLSDRWPIRTWRLPTSRWLR